MIEAAGGMSSRHGSKRISEKEREHRADLAQKYLDSGGRVSLGFEEFRIATAELNERGEVLVVPVEVKHRNTQGETGFSGQYVNPRHLRISKRN